MKGLIPLAVGAAYGAWTSWRSDANYAAVARLAPDEPARTPSEWPFVSIIIPARNEAHNLPRLLTSLGLRARPAPPQPPQPRLSLHPSEAPGTNGPNRPNGATGAPRAAGGRSVTPAHEVVVVDDASSDATGELASALGARVLRLEEDERLAEPDGDGGGWMGKPYACWQGAGVARGEWLLFLDADTTLGPDALGDTLSYALAQGVDALSILLQQRCDTFWERLLLPFAYQQLFAGIGRAGLGSGAAQGAMLNGQFILIRRAVYAAVGGHGAVRDSIVEDVALARVLAEREFRVETLRGEHLGSVRMYRDLASIREGFGKNAYAFLAGEPGRGLRVALSSACAAAALPLLSHAARSGSTARLTALGAGALAWAALAAGLAGWVARYNVPVWYALGQPLAATVFNAIAIESTVRSLTGRAMTWKGRRYVMGTPVRPPVRPPGPSLVLAQPRGAAV